MSALDGTVKLPAVGTVKKAYVAAGVVAVAGIAGLFWYRRLQEGEETGPPEGSDGGLYVDTRTGSELPTSEYVNPAPNADGQSGTGIGGDSTWKAPTTDQEWSAQVIEKLSWYEPGFVSSIVSRYLARQPITSDEANVVREGWAQVGQPPGRQVIILKTTGTGTTTPTPTTPKPTTPAKPPAIVKKAPVNLRATAIHRTGVSLDWSTVPYAIGYAVFRDGTRVTNPYTSAAPIAGLKPGTRYRWSVRAVFPGNVLGPSSSTITVSTKK